MSFVKRHDDRYENALNDVIARCDGDTWSALKVLLAANEYLETELCMLRDALRQGRVPREGMQGALLN